MTNTTAAKRQNWFVSILKRLVLPGIIVVTLIVLTISFENWRGSRAWKNYRAAAETRGAIFEMAALVPPTVPEELNFAEIPLLQSLFRYQSTARGIVRDDPVTQSNLFEVCLNGGKPGFTPQTGDWRKGAQTDFSKLKDSFLEFKGGRPVPANRDWNQISTNLPPLDYLAQYLSYFEPELQQVVEGLKRPHARFAIHYGDERPYSILLPHLSVLKNLAQVFQLRALIKLKQGKIDGAADDVTAIFKLAEAVKDEHLIIDQLVRMAIVNIGLQVVWEGVQSGSWNPPSLDQFERTLANIQLTSGMLEAFKMERAAGTTTILQLAAHPMEIDKLAADATPSLHSTYLLFLVFKGWAKQEVVNYNRLVDSYLFPALTNHSSFVVPAVTEAMDREMTASIRTGSAFSHKALSSLLLPAVNKAIRRMAETQADIHLARLSIAIEKMRKSESRIPDRLGDMVPKYIASLPTDPILGEPMRFIKHSNSSYSIYSLGWDAKDNGGVLPVKVGSSDSDKTGDWVWKVGDVGKLD